LTLTACGTAKPAPEGASATGRAGDIVVQDLYVPPPRGSSYSSGSSAGIEVTLFNSGKDRDVLLGASSPRAGSTLVQQDGRTNRRVDIPAQKRTSRGLVVLLQALRGPLAPGDRVSVTLRFQSAGELTLSAPVRR
jgi:copper(I)-binding protein